MEILEKDNYYHIFNRGINSENIIRSDRNKIYFLQLYKKHLSDFVTTAYCLLNNHFHFAIRIDQKNKEVTQAFSNFFKAYAKAFNKAHSRTGSLFEKNFRRIKIDKEKYLKNLVLYIHFNPQIHFGINYYDYKFSSFQPILQENNEIVNLKEVLNVFDDLENFKNIHHHHHIIRLEENFRLE
ncbi:hypothetical protein [Gramella sp. AN32]|uniref:Transposase n=1 Tax=Christiangramia antarctica TaxID=2058158 RepID=A0ABW5X787_9FLAO|nr:hypothetical protein [Gramella sp. AN32]MCM4155381.1 hypothetical protein [Gramella sp. AN32]